MKPVLELKDISKSFDGTPVLDKVNIAVEEGEFITFLGPSGCGKTTMLRIIAGLEKPDGGQVFLAGEEVTNLEPNRRSVNTVFQNYALFPHKNVAQNIGYALTLQGVNKKEKARRVEEMLRLVQLEGFEKRMPAQLSGGQRQRVAIARALIAQPRVLLLDEPLGALDLQLRRDMQSELKRLQKKLSTTFLYITHDQEEAINMSDRIVVMHNHGFAQIGTPAEVYDHPRTDFVARFLGTANLIVGEVTSLQEECCTVEVDGVPVSVTYANAAKPAVGQRVMFLVRSENLVLSEQCPQTFGLPAQVLENHYAGGTLHMQLRLSNGQELTASRTGIRSDLKAGGMVYVSWNEESAVLVEEEKKEE